MRCQSALRVILGKMTLSEVFENRTTITENVESALND